jgi:DNA-binding transcriptional LysR family regulator
MKLEVRDIEYFAVVAQHGHVGRAAEQLGLSQPALSKSLRRLEQSLGAKVVKKTPKGVDLTAVGTALFSRVRGLQLSLDDIAREAADLSEGRAGRLSVGTGPGIAESILPDVCSALLTSAPKINVSVTIAASNDVLLPALRHGELDVVVNHVRQAALYHGLVREPLWNNEFVVYCSTAHRLTKRKSVMLADLVKERWVTTAGSAYTSAQSLTQTFANHGLPPPEVALVSDSGMLNHRTVASTDLLGFGNKRVTRHAGLTVLRLKDVQWLRPVAVVYRQDAYLSPAALRFIEVLKATAKKIVDER